MNTIVRDRHLAFSDEWHVNTYIIYRDCQDELGHVHIMVLRRVCLRFEQRSVGVT